MKLATKTHTILASLAFAAFALTASASFAGVATAAKVPTTAAEHEARAKQYRDQAAQYKTIAAEHRAMAAEYATTHQPTNGPTPNPSNTKMQKHCEAIAKDADKMAADSEQAANYHTMRAKELQGK
jgi:hypothetical protein